MIILGLDPGTATTGYGVIKSAGQSLSDAGIRDHLDACQKSDGETLRDDI